MEHYLVNTPKEDDEAPVDNERPSPVPPPDSGFGEEKMQ